MNIKYRILSLIPDKMYLKLKYWLIYKKHLDFKNPTTFNEKMQYLKLYDRNKQYTKMVDKYEVKEYVANIIGDEYIIPTLGIYNKFDDIDFSKLPQKFVIKCTHDSGSVIIVKDKDKLNIDECKKKINRRMKLNYYYMHREWPYKNVKPRIIIEKYMEDTHTDKIRDYKFFCFNGKPEIMYISEGLENHATASMSFYDMDFNLTDCKRKDFKKLDYTPKRPKEFEKMKKFACKLSRGIPHLRVDFYEIDGHLYFGELTFTTCAGFIPFEDEVWDVKLGNLLDIKKEDHHEK